MELNQQDVKCLSVGLKEKLQLDKTWFCVYKFLIHYTFIKFHSQMQENLSFYPTNWEPAFATLLGLVVYLALDDF